MRCVIHANRNWEITITCPTRPEKRWQRQLIKWPDGENSYFPGPPTGELPAPDDSHFAICAGDAGAFMNDHRNINLRDLRTGEVERFGRYLFDTLIGSANWTEIKQAADDAAEKSIELSLSWERAEGALHRLTWEMMRTPEGFLFLERGKKVSITRVVANTADIKSRPAGLPPRLLFIIGTSLNDAKIRPGAEYLGLLRQLKRNERSIHSRVLQRASPQQISETMKSFDPDVVHLICHGGIDRLTGLGYLELELDEAEAERRSEADSKRRSAEQLLEYLKVEGRLPGIVVLSACQSGSTSPLQQANAGETTGAAMLGAHELAPLAADLVKGGVPVVIGMAGQISDLACRLFTRGFGEALVGGEPLVLATSAGRRAAFSEGEPPHNSADWAFPTVFMAEGVDPDYVPAQAGPGDTNAIVNGWTERYKIGSKLVFCSRDEFFDEYYELFKPKGVSVLVAYVEKKDLGYGRTRLLQHLAAVALRDGHVPVPCFLGTDAPDWLPPRNIGQLCVEILRAIGVARSALALAPPIESKLLKVLKSKKNSAEIRALEQDFREDPDIYFGPLIECFTGIEDVLTVNSIREALQTDLAALITNARREHPSLIKADARPLLLLDEVHLYDKALSPLFYELFPLFCDVPDQSSQSMQRKSVPVVLTLSFGTPADEFLRPIKEKASTKPWIKFKQLKEFDKGEDMLAYEQVLLHPFDETLDKGISDKSWAFNYSVSPHIIELYEERFRSYLKKIPSDFSSRELFMLARFAKDGGFLVAADDDIYLEKNRTQE